MTWCYSQWLVTWDIHVLSITGPDLKKGWCYGLFFCSTLVHFLIWRSLSCASSSGSFPTCYSCCFTHTLGRKSKLVVLHKWAHRHPCSASVTGERVMTSLMLLTLNPSYRWLWHHWDSNPAIFPWQDEHFSIAPAPGKDAFFTSGKDVSLFTGLTNSIKRPTNERMGTLNIIAKSMSYC